MKNKLKLTPLDNINKKNELKYNEFKEELDISIESQNMTAIIGEYSTGKSSYIKTYKKDKKLKNVYDVSFYNSENKDGMDDDTYETYVMQSIYEQLRQQIKPSLSNNLDVQLFIIIISIIFIFIDIDLLSALILKINNGTDVFVLSLFGQVSNSIVINSTIFVLISFIAIFILIYIVIYFCVNIANKYTVDKFKIKLKSTIMDIELTNEDGKKRDGQKLKSYQLFQRSILELIIQSEVKDIIIIFQDLDRVADERLIRILKDLNEAIKNKKIKASMLVPIKRDVVGDIKTKVKYFDDIIYIKRDINESNNFEYFLEHIDQDIKEIILQRDGKTIKFEEIVEINYLFQFIPADLRVLNNFINEVNSEKDYIIKNRDKVDVIIYFICCRNIFFEKFNILTISKYLSDSQDKYDKLQIELKVKQDITDEYIFSQIKNQNVKNLGFDRFINEKNSFYNNNNYRSGYDEFINMKKENSEIISKLKTDIDDLFTTKDQYWKDYKSPDLINYGLEANFISHKNIRFIEDAKTYENMEFKILKQGYTDAKNKIEYLVDHYNNDCANEAYFIGAHIPNAIVTKRMIEAQEKTYFKNLSEEEFKILLICEPFKTFIEISKYLEIDEKVKVEDLINQAGKSYHHNIEKYKSIYDTKIGKEVLDYSRNVSQYSRYRYSIIENFKLTLTVNNFKWVYENDILKNNEYKYLQALQKNEIPEYSFNSNIKYLELELDFEMDDAVRLLYSIGNINILGGKEHYLKLVFNIFDRVEIINKIFLYQYKDEEGTEEDEAFDNVLKITGEYLEQKLNKSELIEIYEKLESDEMKSWFSQYVPTWYKKIVIDEEIEEIKLDDINEEDVNAIVRFINGIDELIINAIDLGNNFKLTGFYNDVDPIDYPLFEETAKLSMFTDFDNAKVFLKQLIETSNEYPEGEEMKNIINAYLMDVFEGEKDNIDTETIVKLVEYINSLEISPQKKSNNTKYKNRRLKH